MLWVELEPVRRIEGPRQGRLPRFTAEGHTNRQTRTVERTLTGTIRMAGSVAKTEGQVEKVWERQHTSSEEGKTERAGIERGKKGTYSAREEESESRVRKEVEVELGVNWHYRCEQETWGGIRVERQEGCEVGNEDSGSRKRGENPQELILSALGKRSDLILRPPARMSRVH